MDTADKEILCNKAYTHSHSIYNESSRKVNGDMDIH